MAYFLIMIKKLKLLSEFMPSGYTLLLLNCIALVIYYHFKVGSYLFFGIQPLLFIEFTVQNFIFTFTSIVIIFPIFVFIYNKLLNGNFNNIRLILFACAILLFALVFTNEYLSYILMIDINIIFIIFSIILIFIIIILRLLYNISKLKIFHSIILFIANFKISLPKNGKINSITITNSFIFLFLLFSILALIVALGYSRAKGLYYNYLNISGKTYLVIDKYTDKLLIMPVDLKTGIVKRQVFIYKIEDLTVNKSPLILKNIKISKITD